MSEQRIVLKNVRLSFPSVFKKAVFNGDETKYEATFLIPKEDKATIAKIEKAIADALAEKKIKVPASKVCLRDGDESDYDGYAGHMSFKAANKNRPAVLNRDKTPLTEDDDVIYAGCYVDASVDVWVQNNSYGKRVNGNLYAIRFRGDGEPFGSGHVSAEKAASDFDDLEDDLEDDDVPF